MYCGEFPLGCIVMVIAHIFIRSTCVSYLLLAQRIIEFLIITPRPSLNLRANHNNSPIRHRTSRKSSYILNPSKIQTNKAVPASSFVRSSRPPILRRNARNFVSPIPVTHGPINETRSKSSSRVKSTSPVFYALQFGVVPIHMTINGNIAESLGASRSSALKIHQ
jgi:hypothetical protein